ncbi:hypothetical protein P9228_30920, partial [Mesorhizobium sp. WSM4898]|uniref:hypothetical protein n=1 Tax=Mesorhizobium sp. WSM4898 TaxID=3038544 RepID=UPI002414F65F
THVPITLTITANTLPEALAALGDLHARTEMRAAIATEFPFQEVAHPSVTLPPIEQQTFGPLPVNPEGPLAEAAAAARLGLQRLDA